MIAETVSLGILSLPSTLKMVGLVPYAPRPPPYGYPDMQV